MHHLYKKWNHWWLRDAPPHALALFRIGFGIFLLLYWGVWTPSVPLLFSQEGVLLPVVPEYLPSGMQLLLTPPPAGIAWLLFGIFLSCCVLLTIGAFIRISIVMLLVFHFYYWALFLHHIFSTSELYHLFFLIVLLFSGADRAFSLAMWRKHKSLTAWESASVLPQRLMALQISALFLGESLQKAWLPDWQDGEILWYSLQSMWATPLATLFLKLPLSMGFYDGTVLFIKIFQLAAAIGCWIPALRRWFLGSIAIFLISISIFLSMYGFLALLPVLLLFFEPEEVFESAKRAQVHFERWMGKTTLLPRSAL